MSNEALNLGLSWATLGINVFVIFLSFLDQQKTRHKYLLVLFCSNLIISLDNIYELLSAWQFIPQFYNVYLPFVFLLTPSMYLYIKCLVDPQEHTVFDITSPHWLGFIVALILCLPYFFLDVEIKLDRLMTDSDALEHLGIITIGPFLLMLSYIPFSALYIFDSLKLVAKNNINIKSFFSNIEDQDLSWVRWTIVLFMLALIFSTFQFLMPDEFTETSFSEFLSSIFDLLWLSVFAALTLKQQPIVIKKNRLNQVKIDKKYQKSQLGTEEIEQIRSQLKHAMLHLKLYRQPGFTLRDLSDEIGFSQNKISQVLNKNIQQGFYDFINEWRIKEANAIILQESKSILEVAYEVGFNSKSTFNVAFKKYNNMTPSQYKKTQSIPKVSIE